MAHIPETLRIHLTYGAITHGQWCEEHLLPHRTSARVYGLTDGGSRMDLGEVSMCDEDDS